MNANWLKLKTAGLPRWAWLALFGGAVGVGLYLRSRSEPPETGQEEEEEEPEETGLESFNGTESAGGLAAAGLVGPAQASITPVEAPFLPEGFTDLLTEQGRSNVEAQQIIGQLASDALAREPSERVEIIHEREPNESNQGVTGGGAPKRKPHHKAPPKKGKEGKAKKHPPAKHQPPKKTGGGGRNQQPNHAGPKRGAGHHAR